MGTTKLGRGLCQPDSDAARLGCSSGSIVPLITASVKLVQTVEPEPGDSETCLSKGSWGPKVARRKALISAPRRVVGLRLAAPRPKRCSYISKSGLVTTVFAGDYGIYWAVRTEFPNVAVHSDKVMLSSIREWRFYKFLLKVHIIDSVKLYTPWTSFYEHCFINPCSRSIWFT